MSNFRFWLLLALAYVLHRTLKRRVVLALKQWNWSAAEWEARVKLAALYRLAAKEGWDEVIYNHISVRVPGEENILINPFGLKYKEVTASNLLKIDFNGSIVDPGALGRAAKTNLAGSVIHTAIHAARHDIVCIIHHHEQSCVAVASRQGGFIVTCQPAAIIHPDVSQTVHRYEGVVVDEEEKSRLVENLGDKQILLMENHGVLVCGPTIESAYLRARVFDLACKQQCHHLMVAGGDSSKLTQVSEGVIQDTKARLRTFMKGGPPMGKLEFEAECRDLGTRDYAS